MLIRCNMEYIDGVKILKDKSRKTKKVYVKRIMFYEMYKTGPDPNVDSGYRIVGKLMDGKRILHKFDVMWKPPESCLIDYEWINESPVMINEFNGFQSSEKAFDNFISIFRRISDYSIKNKRIIICGYGNHQCDDILFKRWFFENAETWEYGKLFYPATMDLMGASSVFMADIIDRVGGNDLEWAAGLGVRGLDLTKMNVPSYRIDTMIELYKSRFCSALHIHTLSMLEKRVLKHGGRLNNLKRINK